jgi:hypothetical protein
VRYCLALQKQQQRQRLNGSVRLAAPAAGLAEPAGRWAPPPVRQELTNRQIDPPWRAREFLSPHNPDNPQIHNLPKILSNTRRALPLRKSENFWDRPGSKWCRLWDNYALGWLVSELLSTAADMPVSAP